MGWFSGKKKTIVSSTVVSMVTDTPNLVQQSVLSSIINQTDIASDLVSNIVTGLYSDLKKYYNYGLRIQDEMDFIPSSETMIYSTDSLDVEYTIEAEIDHDITIVTCEVVPVDTDYLAYEYMFNNYGYDYETGTFTSLPNELPLATTFFANSYSTDGYVTIDYKNELDVIVYTEITDIEVGEMDVIWYHAVYQKSPEYIYNNPDDLTDVTVVTDPNYYYWNYDTSTNVYPYLSPTSYNPTSNYYPVTPIIRYGVNITEDTSTTRYKKAKLLCKKIGLDIVNISDSLKESEDYDKIEQAHFIPSVRIKDDNQSALKYLYHYFAVLGETSKTSEEDFPDNNFDNGVRTTERFYSDSFKAELSWAYIKREVITKDWEYGADNEYAKEYNDVFITFIRKISNTEQERVTVYDLVHINYVDNKYSVVSELEDMFKDGEDDSEPVTIPLSPKLTVELFPKLLDRNTFIYRTINLVISFKVVVKIKWYQTGFFQFVLAVVAIALTIWSAGTLANSMALAYAAAGGGSAGVIAVIGTAATAAFYSAITSFAMKELIEMYGWEIAAVVGTVLAAFFFSYKTFNIGNLPNAFNLTDFVNNISNSITDYFEDYAKELQDERESLQDDYNEWKESYDEMMEELDGNSELFSSIYKQYTLDRALNNRMTPSTFMYTSIDMITLIPELVTSLADSYIEDSLKNTSDYDIL